MATVRFAVEQDPTKLPALIRAMARIVGWERWRNRINALRSEIDRNPLWQEFLLDRHGLELAFGDIHRYFRTTGRCPWPPRTADEYRLYSFLGVAIPVHAGLSSQAQARFSGYIGSCLEKECGLAPVAFEMKVVAHLMHCGFEIEFHDLECGGGYDFLAISGKSEIEVECKHLSADIGRQIHRRSLYRFGGTLYPTLRQAVGRGRGGQIVEVLLPDRLKDSSEWQRELASRIAAILCGSTSEINDGFCTISTQSFSLQTSPFDATRGPDLTMSDVEAYLNRTFGIDNSHVLANWRPGEAAIIVVFKSKKSDKILERIVKRLKADAKRQFSHVRPAALCVHLADVSQEQLLELARIDRSGTVTGIQRAANFILQKRPHLHTIGMMTDGEVHFTEERSNRSLTRSVQEIGPSYVFRNDNHPMAMDAALQQVFLTRHSG